MRDPLPYDNFLRGMRGGGMIEIQCTSCHTRYRIDERALPDDTPTFKCSRCGHVFNADPVPALRKSAASEPEPDQPVRTPRIGRSRLSPIAAPEKSAPTVDKDPVAEPRGQS